MNSECECHCSTLRSYSKIKSLVCLWIITLVTSRNLYSVSNRLLILLKLTHPTSHLCTACVNFCASNDNINPHIMLTCLTFYLLSNLCTCTTSFLTTFFAYLHSIILSFYFVFLYSFCFVP